MIRVRVQPKAKLNRVEVDDDGNVKVHVTSAPEGGKANNAVIALLAKQLGVARRDVEIVRGQKSRNKLVIVSGMTDSEAVSRLANQ